MVISNQERASLIIKGKGEDPPVVQTLNMVLQKVI